MSPAILINSNDGCYANGRAYFICEKYQIKRTYDRMKEENNGNRPNIAKIARAAKVSRGTVEKKENEILTQNRVVSPDENRARQPIGPGVHTISTFDSVVLMMLHNEDPTRCNRDYAKQLFAANGTIVSESTISRFWNGAFDIKGSFVKPNLIPIDKFRPENIANGHEFVEFMIRQDMRRVKFGDEKHLKGSELYCKKKQDEMYSLAKLLQL